VSSSARRSLRTRFSVDFRFRPDMFSIVLSAQFADNKALRRSGPLRRDTPGS